MISIVICSRNSDALYDVSQNVALTIGVPYEIIAIDNSSSNYGICEAYNVGAAQSQYDVLCFMHEDIAFHTPGWGQTVLQELADTRVGVLGVAGGTYMAAAPSSWNSCGPDYIVMQVRHTVGGQTQTDYLVHGPGTLFPVAAVDGVWLCCRKEVWQQSPFDAVTFPGFHFYDVDFCTRIFPTHQICVTTAVLIEHFSRGSYTKPWYEAALTYYAQRRKYLPFGSAQVSTKQSQALRLHALHQFLLGYRQHGLRRATALRLFGECLRIAPLNRDTLWVMRKWLATPRSPSQALA